MTNIKDIEEAIMRFERLLSDFIDFKWARDEQDELTIRKFEDQIRALKDQLKDEEEKLAQWADTQELKEAK